MKQRHNRIHTILCLAAIMMSLGAVAAASTAATSAVIRPPAPSSYPLSRERDQLKTVRVVLLKKAQQAIIGLPSRSTMRTIETRTVLRGIPPSGTVRVLPQSAGIQIGATYMKIYGVRIEPEGGNFMLEGREYRGHLVIIREKDGTLTFINYLDIDAYLKGVLPREVSPRWEFASLKAQAIASRTFALFTEMENAHRDYSLEKTVASQVYGGKTSEHKRTSQAVDATRGEVLLYNNEVFPAYFHSACGGHTTRADLVWHIMPHPCLRGVVTNYCKGTKHYFWKETIPLREIEEALRNKGYRIKTISNITAETLDASGRVTSFAVVHTGGTVSIPGNRFRLAVGPQHLRSTRIVTMEILGSQDVLFEGFGWGHGVGLCQWGAKGMADEGYTCYQILAHYYPQSEVVKVY